MDPVTVTTGVHFNRVTVIELDIAPMGDDRWMVGISPDCTIFGTAGQLRAVAQQILDQVPEQECCGVCGGAIGIGPTVEDVEVGTSHAHHYDVEGDRPIEAIGGGEL